MQTTTLNPRSIETPHEVTDDAKYDALVASMAASGWTGAPIVIVDREDADPQGITGSHRVEAAREAGIDVPVVELADLFAVAGHNLSREIEAFEAAGLDLWDLVIRIDDYLPADVITKYGIDAH